MFDWHVHDFDELCLVTEGSTRIGHDGQFCNAPPDTLFLFRRGERHGYWNAPRQQPVLWVLHFESDAMTYRAIPELIVQPAKDRIWHLTGDEVDIFKGFFQKIIAENVGRRADHAEAESSWIRLLLLSVRRWQRKNLCAPLLTSRVAAGDVGRMAQIINAYTGNAQGLISALRQDISNYDSLRHAFRKSTGASPTQYWSALRFQRAKTMLLETDQSVKEIAARTGFARQHEFTRAFRRLFGTSPTRWRLNPVS